MIHPCGIILPPYPSFPRKRESTPGNQTPPPATRHYCRPPPSFPRKRESTPGNQTPPPPTRHCRPLPSFPRKRESTPHNQTPPPATRHYSRPPPSFPRKRESTPHNQTPPPAALQPTGTEKPPLSQKGGWGDYPAAAIQPTPGLSVPPAAPYPSFPRKRESTPHNQTTPPPTRHCRPLPSFPRKRESTPHPIDTPGLTGVLDSGLRRNDGGRRAALSDYGVWIPAFAGMTDGGKCERGAFVALGRKADS